MYQFRQYKAGPVPSYGVKLIILYWSALKYFLLSEGIVWTPVKNRVPSFQDVFMS